MRALELRNDWGIENLHLTERPEGAPGPGQLRVRLRAASLNARDLMTVLGFYNPKQPLPLVPCSDGAGVVEAVGDGVEDFAVGDRVIAHFFRDWIAGEPTRAQVRTSLGGPLDGTLREVMVAPAHAFVHTPASLSDAEAATLPCAALTAWSALITQGNLQAGDTVLTLGTGGVSVFAIQIAQMVGARVIATSGSAEKIEVLRDRFGLDDVINYRDEPEWGRAVRKLTDEGVDHVVEVGGAGTLANSLRAVRRGGTVSLIGVLAGVAEPLNLIPILMRNVRVQGVVVGHRQQLEALCRAIDVNGLRPAIDSTFALSEAADAFRHLQAQRHFGKIVVDLSQ
jgi:NADPH:quinone reductase-like Zn-dependent oxidoreductase